MKNIRLFLLRYLDQMICVGGAFVILCLILKFLDAPGGDIFFCFSLGTEAFIFLLGAVKPFEGAGEKKGGEKDFSENLKLNSFLQENFSQKIEKKNAEDLFFAEIEKEIKNINEKINNYYKKKNEKEQQNNPYSFVDKINKISAQIEELNKEVCSLRESTGYVPYQTPSKKEEQHPTSSSVQEPVRRKRGRPRKISQ